MKYDFLAEEEQDDIVTQFMLAPDTPAQSLDNAIFQTYGTSDP